MISPVVHTEGLEGLGQELLAETERDLLPLITRAGQKLAEFARRKLDARGGPSRPGDPPAKDEGTLGDSIGHARPSTNLGTIDLAWGVGVGDDVSAAPEVLAYAELHEHGGTGADGRRYPPRPFIRPTEAELETEVASDIEAGL